MERDTDAWRTDAKFGETHKPSYEIIRGSEHTMEVSGYASQTVDLRPIAEDARHFGAAKAKMKFFMSAPANGKNWAC
jgi:hypothetical protein